MNQFQKLSKIIRYRAEDASLSLRIIVDFENFHKKKNHSLGIEAARDKTVGQSNRADN